MQTGAADQAEQTDDQPVVTACESRPGRTVLIESSNADGWIASDLIVDAESYR